ncbi:hypothetical protein KL915_004621 [Ogataea haglerorum]|nr:hypothetical protein KL915_004621 [Ogataea haglerorum]KAG7784397.1 hypothetical protein KL945_004410 [Ogataea haglerorum]KAG7786085.1 hypothetical protein KL910_004473 [Ogataea haglerorum]
MTSDSETAAANPAEALRLIPPEPTADEQFSLAQVAAGCKVYALKDGEWRLAEILALQRKKGKPVYYVHYVEFNKRLDEWIDETKIDTHRPMYPPKPQKDKKDKKQTRKKAVKKTAPKSETPEPQRATSEPNEDEMDLDNLNVQGLVKEGEELSPGENQELQQGDHRQPRGGAVVLFAVPGRAHRGGVSVYLRLFAMLLWVAQTVRAVPRKVHPEPPARKRDLPRRLRVVFRDRRPQTAHVVPEPVFAVETVSGPQDALLRRRPVPVLLHDQERRKGPPFGGILLEREGERGQLQRRVHSDTAAVPETRIR